MTDEQAPRRRPNWPGWRAVAIGAAVAAIGTAALIGLRDSDLPQPRFVATVDDTVVTKSVSDPLMVELLRCRLLPAGSDDAGCREAWEVNRRRFMGESRTYVAPAAADAGGER